MRRPSGRPERRRLLQKEAEESDSDVADATASTSAGGSGSAGRVSSGARERRGRRHEARAEAREARAEAKEARRRKCRRCWAVVWRALRGGFFWARDAIVLWGLQQDQQHGQRDDRRRIYAAAPDHE